jgi:hypothetical protein
MRARLAVTEVVMRTACWFLVVALGLAGVPIAHADEAAGLTLPRLRGRVILEMGTEPKAATQTGSAGTVSGASVLGDYYFAGASATEGGATGFRATSGVFLGTRLGMWGGPAPAALSGSLIAVERYNFSLLAPSPAGEGTTPENSTLPYLGVGYSAASERGGWGFSADLGLLALNPGSGVRLGRVLSGGQTLDDVLREVRLSPLLQVGVSYRF